MNPQQPIGTSVALTAYNKAYEASRPPAFLKFYDGSLPQSSPARWAYFRQMQQAGYSAWLDEWIEGEGNDPYTTNWMRVLDGNNCVPVGQGNVFYPGQAQPTVYNYNPVPVGYLKVSLDLADYSAWPVPTAPQPPIVPLNPIGQYMAVSGFARGTVGAEYLGNTSVVPLPPTIPGPNGLVYVKGDDQTMFADLVIYTLMLPGAVPAGS